MRRSPIPLPAGAAVVLALVVAGGPAQAAPIRGDAAKPRAVTIAFSNARQVPSASALAADLRFQASADCAGKPVTGSATLTQAIAWAKAIEDRAGRKAVRAVDSGRDGKPALAELDASGALVNGNPGGALAALLAAYSKNPKDATVLRDLGSLLAQLGQPLDALAMFGQADKVGGAVRHPMGISETATELNDRGFALLELRRWAAAGTTLVKAVAEAPLLSEAKLNLGAALLCQGKIAAAAKMMFAGSRRDSYKAYDRVATQTLVPAGELIDVSKGRAGAWPSFPYPNSMDAIDKDGTTFSEFSGDAFTTAVSESQQAAALLATVTLPAVSYERISDLGDLATDAAMGGWASAESKAAASSTTTETFISDTFSAGGTAQAELNDITAAGGNPCTVQKPRMREWLTGQTHTFRGDIVAWDTALRDEWTAASRWISAVYANIATSAVSKAYALGLDEQKQAFIENITEAVWNWEETAVSLDDSFGDCQDSQGPDQPPPAQSVDRIDRCPQDLQRANFSISFEVFRITANCERVSVTVAAPGLGPFGKLTLNRNGDLTIMAGVRAGVSLGAAGAGIKAGAYVTIHSDTISDVGVTATAKATLQLEPDPAHRADGDRNDQLRQRFANSNVVLLLTRLSSHLCLAMTLRPRGEWASR